MQAGAGDGGVGGEGGGGGEGGEGGGRAGGVGAAAAASCTTVTVCPATVTVSERCVASVLGATEKRAAPLPLLLPLVSKVIQGPAALAAHVQLPSDAVTVTVSSPPAAGIAWLLLATASAQDGDGEGAGGTGFGGTPAAPLPAWAMVTTLSPTVTVPVRGVADVFSAKTMSTDVLPVPEGGRTLSQGTVDTHVHAHVGAGALKVTVRVPAPAATSNPVGVTVSAQAEDGGPAADAACVKVKTAPPTLTRPVRELLVVLRATVIVTLPLPEPVLPPATLIHGTVLLVVHAQAESVLTEKVRVPPLASMVSFEGVKVKTQVAAACDTSTRESFTTMLPRREAGAALTATVKLTDPSPCPVVADIKVIQLASERAFQVHSRLTPNATCPCPPAAPMLAVASRKLTAHRVAVGPVTLVSEDDPQATAAEDAAASTRARTHETQLGAMGKPA